MQMKCQVAGCENVATFHITESDDVVLHYCEQHASRGIPSENARSSEQADPIQISANELVGVFGFSIPALFEKYGVAVAIYDDKYRLLCPDSFAESDLDQIFFELNIQCPVYRISSKELHSFVEANN